MPASNAARSRSLHRNHLAPGSCADIQGTSDDVREHKADGGGEQGELKRGASVSAERALAPDPAEEDGWESDRERDRGSDRGEEAEAVPHLGVTDLGDHDG